MDNTTIKTEIKTYRVDKKCVCGKGIMVPTGLIESEQYMHECTYCHLRELYDDKYPIEERQALVIIPEYEVSRAIELTI